jgi:hypothetical protein
MGLRSPQRRETKTYKGKQRLYPVFDRPNYMDIHDTALFSQGLMDSQEILELLGNIGRGHKVHL